MRLRVISALVLLPPMIFILVKGGLALAILVLTASIIGIFEFSRAMGERISKNETYILYVITVLNMFALYMGMKSQTAVILFALLMIEGVLVVTERANPENAVYAVFTYIYVSLSLSCIYAVSKDSRYFFWYIFIFSMITDTFAYFSGYFFGKHKLSSKLSPKKTVEGSIGGMIACVAASVAYAAWSGKESLATVAIFSAAGSIFSQVGDIFASAFKRWAGIKDYGNLIPGHGGVMDRVDSIAFSSLYVFILMQFYKQLN